MPFPPPTFVEHLLLQTRRYFSPSPTCPPTLISNYLSLCMQIWAPPSLLSSLPTCSFPFVISSHPSLSTLSTLVISFRLCDAFLFLFLFFWFFSPSLLPSLPPFFLSFLPLGNKHGKTGSCLLCSLHPAQCLMYLENYKYWMPCVSLLWSRRTQMLNQHTRSKTVSPDLGW